MPVGKFGGLVERGFVSSMHEFQPSRSVNQHSRPSQQTSKPLCAAATAFHAQPEKYQIRAKKGFLNARDITSGLVLLMYSKEFQLGVLLHLPASRASGGDCGADHNDEAFTKSAISMILSEFDTLGVARTELVTYVIGGSASDNAPAVAKAKVQRTLWNFGLSVSACDLGGRQIRSVWMDVESGRTIIRSESSIKRAFAIGSTIPVAS